MQYINHQTHTLYSIEGKPAHWRDIPVTSDPPDQWATPIVEDGKHVGWDHQTERYNLDKIQELKTLLSSTDHKVLPDYELKKNETKSSIKEQRKEWRRELRKLLEDVTS